MSLHAGAATREISPTKPMQLCGYPHVRRISTGIHDPLLASALFLRNESSAILLCALDLIMLNSDVARRIRRAIASALGVAESGVLINCTHTHSAPVTLDYLPFKGDVAMPPPDLSYLDFVERTVVQAAMEAKTKAQPAELAWTRGDARGVGGNRHSPEGPTDPEVGALVVRSAGKLLAVALIYGMHPTVLHEDSTLVSADFPHYARVQLRETLGRELVVLYHTGPAGNQSPRYHVTGQTFSEAERLGRKLGNAALAGMENLKFSDNVALAGWRQSVDLKQSELPSVTAAEELLAAYRTDYERLKTNGAQRPQLRTAEVAVFGAEAKLKLARAQQTGELDRLLARLRPFEVQVLRIGEACLVALPGEFFAEYGLELKQRAPMKSFVITYANGELQGYLVTPEAAVAGGYEAASSLFGPEAGAAMVNAALAAISELAGEHPGEIPPRQGLRLDPQNRSRRREEAESPGSQCHPPPHVGGYQQQGHGKVSS
ncbi:MAG: neutral/alkaline non-lysosomal ceramidase N-terminal domain-containing protein [Verrucomicrobia bacterium]|nr:neutral/alkaline non-lysosomal ceramidase N-terminal domain-containing protein [Verrucomicrobiota bacterium]